MLKNVPFFFTFRKRFIRSRLQFWLFLGLITLLLQLIIYLIILYSMNDEFQWNWYSQNLNFTDPVDDLDIVKQVLSDHGYSIYVTDRDLLQNIFQDVSKKNQKCSICKYIDSRTLELAVSKDIEHEVFEAFKRIGFHSVAFGCTKNTEDLKGEITTAYLIKRHYSFLIVVFRKRESNTWWFGHMKNDVNHSEKLTSIGVPYSNIEHTLFAHSEGLIEKFKASWKLLPGTHLDFLLPVNISAFLLDSSRCRFVECNEERADRFNRTYGRLQTKSAHRFRHKAFKLLSKAKAVLDSLNIEFWLNSGTLLGYARECDIIAHSRDVDIGTMASSYSDRIEPAMNARGLSLMLRLGRPNDSLELSFSDQSAIKLDIFFFYKDSDGTYWNGGTQVKSGRKFKYSFPPFALCWTLFKSLKVKVPCDTEKFVEANYGADWFTPVTKWDWKSSPFNVQPNGQWPATEWPQVIQVFQSLA
ncbi:fukutin [Nilaparvata lugens]|uniref:fukutin n=1 Tax=Nilaparvata lugens TaxID=108931 RepID=UPI000B99330B|nr:fukutin [Nilaparvata lugens]